MSFLYIHEGYDEIEARHSECGEESLAHHKRRQILHGVYLSGASAKDGCASGAEGFRMT
jgi:hypothetical protein